MTELVPVLRRDLLRWFRDHWRHGSRPSSDVLRRVHIGVGRVSAAYAYKACLCLAILTLAMPAHAAGLTGVSGIHRNYGYAYQLGLVRDEVLELSERPAAHSGSLFAPKPYPRADVPKILNGDPAVRAFGGSYKMLGNTVIQVAAEQGFVAPASSQGASHVLGASALALLAGRLAKQPSPAIRMTHADRLSFHCGVTLAITRRGDIDNAHVYPDEAVYGASRRLGHVIGHLQEPKSIPAPQKLRPLEVPTKANTCLRFIRDANTARNTQHRDSFAGLKGERARIEGDRRVRAKSRDSRTVATEHSGDTAAKQHRGTRSDVELVAHLAVKRAVHRNALEYSSCMGFGSQPVRCRVVPLHRLDKQSRLRIRWVYLHLRGQKHPEIYRKNRTSKSPEVALTLPMRTRIYSRI